LTKTLSSLNIKWRRNIAENFNRLSRVHERYRQTAGRRPIANMNMSSRSLKTTRPRPVKSSQLHVEVG